MHHYYFFVTINLSLIALAFVSGLLRMRRFDTSFRIATLLVAITLAEEALACYCAMRYHNNIWILNIFNIVEIILLSLYFNYSIADFKRRNIGIVIAVISLCLSIVTRLSFRSLNTFGGFFFYYEGVMIIAMSWYAIFKMAEEAQATTKRVVDSPHYWFASVQIVFWCLTILLYTFYRYLAGQSLLMALTYGLTIINDLYYFAMAVIFLRYPKTVE